MADAGFEAGIPVTRALRVEALGKVYKLGEHANARDTLREALHGVGRRVFRRPSAGEEAASTLWALREVSFEVSDGEIVGVIGRNGAGKSTLLKILAGITVPTEGRALLAGSVASLLEVGTGFHPELTGRDNIFLNGAILGLTRADVRKRFDEIVSFSGVEKFIDTPVKRYSSGMQVRLAFAVAAHLEPEILLIDEVLAVGDSEFQKKCLGKIEEVRSGGRTVLFVSHNMPMVVRLCPRVILMERGRLVADAHGPEVVRSYLETGAGTRALRQWRTKAEAPGDGVARLRAVRVTSDGRVSEEVDITKSVSVEVEFWRSAERPELSPLVTLQFTNDDGVVVFVSSQVTYRELSEASRAPGVVHATCTIPGNFLAEGQLIVGVVISSLKVPVAHVYEEDVVSFQVVDVNVDGAVRGEWAREWPGAVRPKLPWHVRLEPDVVGDGP